MTFLPSFGHCGLSLRRGTDLFYTRAYDTSTEIEDMKTWTKTWTWTYITSKYVFDVQTIATSFRVACRTTVRQARTRINVSMCSSKEEVVKTQAYMHKESVQL